MVPRPPSASRAVVAVCVLACIAGVAAGGFVGSADAAPPPRPVCAGCGDAIEERATEFGVTLTVQNSTATVTVHDNGTGRWVVENRLAASSETDRLRENETLRDSIADARYWDPDVVSTTVTAEGTLVARYREPGFASDGLGDTLRSGAFTHEYGYRNLEGLGADRLTVVAPDGMTVAQTVPGATRTDEGTRMVLTEYDRGGFVTFVPENAILGFLWGWVTITAVLGPVVIINAAIGILLPATVVGAAIGVCGRLLASVSSVGDTLFESPGRMLAGLGTVGVLAALAGRAGGLAGPLTATVFGVCVVAVIAGLSWSQLARPELTFWRVGALAVAGVALATAATLVGVLLFAGHVSRYGFVTRLPTVLALFAFVPAGYAVQQGDHWRGALTSIVGVVVALALVVPLTATSHPFGLGSRVAFATASALGLVVAGLPFLVVGASLATE